MIRRHWRLPVTNEMTTDEDEYIAAWEAIANPICEATGAELLGFDPTISFYFEHEVAQMPVGFAKALAEALGGEQVTTSVVANDGAE